MTLGINPKITATAGIRSFEGYQGPPNLFDILMQPSCEPTVYNSEHI